MNVVRSSIDLHAVGADVARAVVGIARDHQRHTDEPPCILRPAFLDGERIDVRFLLNNLLTGARLDALGFRVAQFERRPEQSRWPP